MTDERRQVDDDPDSGDESRRQLWFRAGVAGGLIALLLGALAVFDHLAKPRGGEELALPTKPIAPAQVTPDVGRDAPPEVIRAGTEGAQPEAVEEPPLAEAAVPPLPRDAAGPDGAVDRLESPRTATVRPHQAAPAAHGREVEHRAAARAGETPRVVTAPAPPTAPPAQAPRVASAPALVQPPVSPAPQRDAPAAATAAPVAPRPQASASPSVVAAPGAAAPAAVMPLSPAVPAAAAGAGAPARAAAAVPAPAADTAARGYVLQFGFFSSVARAEELKARLAQAGIPAQVETRLVVGPFADRKEALAAQSRLREKGIDTGVLLPLGR